MEQPMPIIGFIDDETNGARACELEHDRIHPRDVIWQEKKAFLGQLLFPRRL